MTGFNPLTVDIGCCASLEYFLLRLCRRWVMSLVSIKLIYTVVNLSYVIYRCSVYIGIYLYDKLNCYALILCNRNIPCYYSARLCSAIIC